MLTAMTEEDWTIVLECALPAAAALSLTYRSVGPRGLIALSHPARSGALAGMPEMLGLSMRRAKFAKM